MFHIKKTEQAVNRSVPPNCVAVDKAQKCLLSINTVHVPLIMSLLTGRYKTRNATGSERLELPFHRWPE